MQFNIEGGNFPVALCHLSQGEAVVCQSGAMSWMDEGIKMETKANGVGKAIGRIFSGENFFQNRYVAEQDGTIAFSANSPGEIRAVEIGPGKSIVAQKGAFLASDEGVELSIFFQKKVGTGIFGGEGFIMQKFSGNGTVLVEVDGGSVEYDLAAGEKKIIDTGYLVMMDDTCSIDIVTVKGVKNVLFGGEGLFNTVVTGPGKIVLQTMPLIQMASRFAAISNIRSGD